MKIAAFKMVGWNTETRTVWEHRRMEENGCIEGYIRTSEWVEVAFPPRVESTVPEEVAALDAKLDELKTDFAKKVNAIETAKANLLALTDNRESA